MSVFSVCKLCKARIRWIRMPTDKLMPCDAEPSLIGSVALHSDGIKGAVLTDAEKQQLPRGLKLFVPHWITCHDPEFFKKGKKARKKTAPPEPRLF